MVRKRRAPSSEQEQEGKGSQKRKFVACQRCHTHKIKCSGDQPCRKCCAVGCADECAYASRDRQVKVSENYLDQILAENQRLREQSVTSAQVAEANDPTRSERGPSRLADGPDGTGIQNPIIGDRAWFHRYDPSSPPIYIGEAACSAFATRFRRFLMGNSAMPHIPRTQYESEEIIAASNEVDIQWPSLHHARLLVRIAIHQIGHLYHLMMRKSTLDKLEEIYQKKEFDCTANKCKFFALFAFGQAYSIRSEPHSGSRVPGTSYFARSMGLVQILPERTSITHLETLLLLGLFSYYLNRRHSAYILIGNAMRMGLTIGLNHNIPESQLIDPVERQHRIGIWWTIYMFDRMWGSKMGLPMQILDEDIHVDMPSTISPRWRHEEELSDTDYMTANIKLARIVGETITKLYSRRKYQETFLQRVQKLLKALKNWVETLPESLKLNMEDLESSKKNIVSLHMAFNQCIILTTRPTLLHLLMNLRPNKPVPKSNVSCRPRTHTNPHPQCSQTNKDIEPETETETDADIHQHPHSPAAEATPSASAPSPISVSQPVLTLSEACIHAARHSHSMILTRWINGTMPTFGYFHAHYLFSSALILAMSSFVPIGTPADMTCFDSALDLLRSMTENGNLAAAEFYHNLEQVKVCLDPFRGIGAGVGAGAGTGTGTGGLGLTARRQEGNTRPDMAAVGSSGYGHGGCASATLPHTSAGGLAPGLAGPTSASASASRTGTIPSVIRSGSATSSDLHILPTSTPIPLSTLSSTASMIPTSNELLVPHGQIAHSQAGVPYSFPVRDTVSGYTTEMAFLEPTMQDFLAQSDIDLGLLHPVDAFFSEAENLYTCHEL